MSSRSDRHVTEEALEQLWQGESDLDLRALARHLVGGCRECAKVLRPWFFPQEVSEEEQSRSPHLANRGLRGVRVWARELARRQRRERDEVPQLLDRLEGLPAERQALFLRSSLRFRTPAMVDGLIEAANHQLSSDIRRAVTVAELATVAAEALAGGELPEALACDYRMRAAVCLARALRRSGDLLQAQRTLDTARRLAQEGTGDRLELAALLEEESLHRRTEARFTESLSAVDRAHAIYRKLGDPHLAARALIQRANVLEAAGKFGESVRDLAKAARSLDPERNPRLVLMMVHNLALTVATAGHTLVARRLLQGAEPLYAALGRPVDLLKARWLIGSLLLEEGNVIESSHLLAEVRNQLAERDLPVEAALVSLELALALARQGRTDEVRDAVLSAIPVFEARRIGRDLMAALSCLRRAAEAEAATSGLITDALELVRSWRREAWRS